MPQPPSPIRCVAFFDGQNLFYSAKAAFGFTYPNYDPAKLARAICAQEGWECVGVRFYSGVPDADDNKFWNHFWVAKGAQMGRDGVKVFTRPLRYRNKVIRLPNGKTHAFLDGVEKGIDVRIAIDVIRLASRKAYDVALIFSRDQDLAEASDEVRVMAKEQDRWIKVASAFPSSPAAKRVRGIDRTDWIRIDRETYEACIDPRDYREKIDKQP